MLTPKEFLAEKGINLNTTTLVTVIDGYMRQPDLCFLMQEYAELSLKGAKDAIEDKGKDFLIKLFKKKCCETKDAHGRYESFKNQFQQNIVRIQTSENEEYVAIGYLTDDSGRHHKIWHTRHAGVDLTKAEYDDCFNVFKTGKE